MEVDVVHKYAFTISFINIGREENVLLFVGPNIKTRNYFSTPHQAFIILDFFLTSFILYLFGIQISLKLYGFCTPREI